jgi:fumarate hydratase subunit alpha
MRKVSANTVENTVRKLCLEAAINLSPEVLPAIKKALTKEKTADAKEILEEIVRNEKAAREDKLPLCQDTGFAVFFIEIGQEVLIKGDLNQAVSEGVARGYKYLRKSLVQHPFQRKNTYDNTPPIIHLEQVPGDKLKIGILPKGGGAENCSFLKMLLPANTKEEISDFIVEESAQRISRACPPVILGIGIGGTFDYCAFLAKKALTRPLGQPSPDPRMAAMEKELLGRINKLGIGPMGLKGKTTALAVHIEPFACHIASLPVAVNMQCHSHRYREVIL